MAIPTFTVNAGSEIPGVTANWQRIQKRRNSNGSIDWQPYALHTWDIPKMEMATFLILRALQGAVLTSLATTDVDDRSIGATYAGAEITGVIGGQQVGRYMVGVRVEFRVDIL